jgi:UDP-2,3-diacylglucosamine pyrophosphatase LpxH
MRTPVLNTGRVNQIITIIETISFIRNRSDRSNSTLMFVGTTFDLLVGDKRDQVDVTIFSTFRNAAATLAQAKFALDETYDAERESELSYHDQIVELTKRKDRAIETLREVLGYLCCLRFGEQPETDAD